MKKSYLCTGVALACALGLSACGGGSDHELQLSLSLFGVNKAGLTITNNGGEKLTVAPGSRFVFPNLIEADSDFNIQVVDRPPNTDSCTVLNGKGNSGSYSPNNIAIVCVVTTFPLGGSVTGLNWEGLKVNNGAHSVTIAAGATAFTMTSPTIPKLGEVAEGVPYGLTILEQPTGGTCTIAAPSGTMPAAAVTNIAITCTPVPAA